MNVDLEMLGITREQLLERIVSKVAQDLLTVEATDSDEGGKPYSYTDDSAFAEQLHKLIKVRINDTVAAMAERHVLPQVSSLIETFTIQKTNEWGEKRGEPVTFIEYLTKRADEYLREPVDSQGRSQEECRARGDSFHGRKTTPRIARMIDSHLSFTISQAMEAAMKEANSSIVGGIRDAVAASLAEVQAKLKVQVTTR